jgi:hypothetical protein
MTIVHLTPWPQNARACCLPGRARRSPRSSGGKCSHRTPPPTLRLAHGSVGAQQGAERAEIEIEVGEVSPKWSHSSVIRSSRAVSVDPICSTCSSDRSPCSTRRMAWRSISWRSSSTTVSTSPTRLRSADCRSIAIFPPSPGSGPLSRLAARPGLASPGMADVHGTTSSRSSRDVPGDANVCVEEHLSARIETTSARSEIRTSGTSATHNVTSPARTAPPARTRSSRSTSATRGCGRRDVMSTTA